VQESDIVDSSPSPQNLATPRPPTIRHQQEEQERAAVLAEEARRREVARAVREFVAASEAKRREEHGAGPSLEELVRRKKVSLLQQYSTVQTVQQ